MLFGPILLVQAFLFGLSLAAAVGPIALLIATTSLRDGLGAGLRCGAGAALADFCYAGLALMAGAVLAPVISGHRAALSAVASAVLVGFGLWMLRGAWRAGAVQGQVTPMRRPFWGTFGLTIVNPLTLIAFAGFTGQTARALDGAQVLAAALALAAGSLTVGSLFAAGGAVLARMLKDQRVVRGLNAASALAIIGFGVAGLI